MTSSSLAWIVTAICLAGTVLNVKKLRWCFHLWVIGNLLWLAIDMHNQLYSRALLDFVQLILAAWGLIEWTEERA